MPYTVETTRVTSQDDWKLIGTYPTKEDAKLHLGANTFAWFVDNPGANADSYYYTRIIDDEGREVANNVNNLLWLGYRFISRYGKASLGLISELMMLDKQAPADDVDALNLEFRRLDRKYGDLIANKTFYQVIRVMENGDKHEGIKYESQEECLEALEKIKKFSPKGRLLVKRIKVEFVQIT